jgi:glycosyltransferase involved in cell wall biosynthesis
MTILVIRESVPFPSYNGRELKDSKLLETLQCNHDVHLLVLSRNKNADIKKISHISEGIKQAGIIEVSKENKKERLLQLFGLQRKKVQLSSSHQSILHKLSNVQFDFVWVSPVTLLPFIEYCKQQNFLYYKYIAVGHCDAITYLYRDSINEMIHTRIFKWRYLTDWLQSFVWASHERNYLSNAALVHVQTEMEKQKIQQLSKGQIKAKIIVASNGTKQELFDCSYKGINSEFILFMTHLDGGRADESDWFLRKVWPLIIKKISKAKLLIIGRSAKAPHSIIEKDPSIIANGYADDLVALFDSIRLAIVPTFHGTGLINRILDALTAAVPTVSTAQAIATFPALQPGTHILSAQTPKDFAHHVITLYNDKEYRQTIALDGRNYAKQFSTWPRFVRTIEKAMIDILEQ